MVEFKKENAQKFYVVINKTCHERRMNIIETYNGLNIYTHASLQKKFVTLLCVQYKKYCVGHNVILIEHFLSQKIEAVFQ